MSLAIVPTACPVCSYHVAARFFDGGQQPLATLGWPASEAEAHAMPRHPHTFVQCLDCSHVWNDAFTYDAVPYRNNPNRMFNCGGHWKGHLAATRDLVLGKLPASPRVVEIGCGEGHFLRGVAEALNGQGEFAGFDPNASLETGIGLTFHSRLFDPLEDMLAFEPDMIIVRHVIEHLTDPAALVERLAWGASRLNKPCWIFIEAPCIDRVFSTGRVADFYFEHASHFTSRSFERLMSRGGAIETLEHGYDGEVIYALVRLEVSADRQALAKRANAFDDSAIEARKAIGEQLAQISGQGVAIWGGTGKGAAFIHQFGLDADRFPLVVDSDPDKIGTFVPGTGQPIQFRDALKGQKLDVIIIPTQWRAKDIVAEMEREGIVADRILIEHQGALVDFRLDEHPYQRH